MELYNDVKVTSFAITVALRMHKPLVLGQNRDLTHWENVFFDLRCSEKNSEYRKNYERCSMILQFANSCWGSLKDISNGHDVIIFTFEFDSITALINFEEGLKKAKGC